MKLLVRFCLAIAGLVALGASPQPRSAHAIHLRPARPSSVDRNRYDRFAPNAIRRARLAFLTPKRLSATRLTADARGDAGAAASSYTVLNLNAFIKSSGVTIDPLALNNAGQIVGSSSAGDAEGGHFGYIINSSGSNGSLDHFGEFLPVYFTDYPTAISNDGRTVAGYSDYTIETIDSTTTITIPLIWTLTGAISSVEHSYYLIDGGPVFTGISNQITINGAEYVDNRTLSLAAFPVSNCPMSNFYAGVVNDSGVIVGGDPGAIYPEVLTLGGCPRDVPFLDGGADAIATNGDMIIFRNDGLPYLWAKGRVYPLPLPSGYDASKYYLDPIGLNASDVVVGNVLARDGSSSAAFVYTNGNSFNLQALFPPNSGWVPSYVTGINDSGEIIGEGYLKNVRTPFALRK